MKKLINITYKFRGETFHKKVELEWFVYGNLMTARVNEYVKVQYGKGAKLVDWETDD